MAKTKSLGSGLDLLFDTDGSDDGLMTVAVTDIEPNKNQPRKIFNQEALEELSQSIKEYGLLQPVVVRKIPGGMYQIIAGERRWRASRLAELKEIPVIIKDVDDAKVLEIAMIENLQRKDLTPVEEAMGYRELMDTFKLTQDDVSKLVGKSRSVIANSVRLLNLPERALDELNAGNISAGHGRVLAGHVDNEELFDKLLDRTITDELSVHQLEDLANILSKITGQLKLGEIVPTDESTWGNPLYLQVESSLRDILGTKVKVRKKGKAGSIEIQFSSEDELQDLANKLGKGE